MQERCTSRQVQTLIVASEDSRLTQQDIYLLYIDFKNAFGSIDHARLLVIMVDLGYPQDAINLIGNIILTQLQYSLAHILVKPN